MQYIMQYIMEGVLISSYYIEVLATTLVKFLDQPLNSHGR